MKHITINPAQQRQFIEFNGVFDVVFRDVYKHYDPKAKRIGKKIHRALGGVTASIIYRRQIFNDGLTSKEQIRDALMRDHGSHIKKLADSISKHRDAELVLDEDQRLREQADFQDAIRIAPKRSILQTRSSEARGFVYVVSSPSFPGWIKIGQTLDLQQRLMGFNTHTPHGDFRYEFYHGFPDRRLAEKIVHRFFSKQRGKNGEWFQLDVGTARTIILELADRIEEKQAA